MNETRAFEHFPTPIVLLCNTVPVLIYLSGIAITLKISWIAALVYFLFILASEYRLLSRSCTRCYYYGKNCGFGKGRVSSWFFKRKEPMDIFSADMTWKDLIPDILISLIPLVTGIILMIVEFNILILLAVIIIVVMSSAGNGYIRSNFACKFCRQRIVGCPAQKFFGTDRVKEENEENL